MCDGSRKVWKNLLVRSLYIVVPHAGFFSISYSRNITKPSHLEHEVLLASFKGYAKRADLCTSYQNDWIRYLLYFYVDGNCCLLGVECCRPLC